MQNIEELRKSLTDNYTKMKAGDMEVTLGKELANTAGKILKAVNMQIDYNNLMGKKDTIPFLEKQ